MLPFSPDSHTLLLQQQQSQLGSWQLPSAPTAAAAGADVSGVLQMLLQSRRGLMVVGEQLDSGAAAAALQLAALLGWPVAADVLSGLRVGSSGSSSSSGGYGSSGGSDGGVMLQHMDHLLLPPPAGAAAAGGGVGSWWCELQPDLVLQVGPRVTSKRLNQFMVSFTMNFISWEWPTARSCSLVAQEKVLHILTHWRALQWTAAALQTLVPCACLFGHIAHSLALHACGSCCVCCLCRSGVRWTLLMEVEQSPPGCSSPQARSVMMQHTCSQHTSA